jgi:hypothetical protein
MHRMGLGGFFMHSRSGLATEYLSEEWFECVKACVDEAEKLNMRAWLYDEDRWPSGAGGGLVTENPEFRAKYLILEEIDSSDKYFRQQNELGLFQARIDGHHASDIQVLKKAPEKLPAGYKLLCFYYETEQCSGWYNNQSYLDVLNKDAVSKFIQVTHEAYKMKLDNKLGKCIPGIFTDEPHFISIGDRFGENRWLAPWTTSLPKTFKERYGYTLLDHLPELFYESETAITTKVHYVDCLTYMFTDAFAKQIGDWCGKNNLLSTGHCLAEDELSSQTNTVGSCMRFYEHMQAPGIDLLTERRRSYDTVKQLSSVARQCNQKWRLCETYGCTGWDFSFEGHKAVGDWLAALGVNLRCQHLAWYSMEGNNKRDYPASISYQSSWFEQYSKVEDYFARINMLLSQGHEVRDCLLIHPVESSWTMIGKEWTEREPAISYDAALKDLRDCLLNANLDFDYGDEDIMARHALIDQNKRSIKVGHAEYKIIIIPLMRTMRSSTVKLIKEFLAAGGKVIFTAEPPVYVDAKPSELVCELAKELPLVPVGPELSKTIECYMRRVSITSGGKEIDNTLYMLRENDNSTILFICNTGYQASVPSKSVVDERIAERTKAYPKVQIKLWTSKVGDLVELDLETGRLYRINTRPRSFGWEFETSLDALGSRMFMISSEFNNADLYPYMQLQTSSRQPYSAKDDYYKISLSEANVLTLDRAALQINDQKNISSRYILELDLMVREFLKIPSRRQRQAQPWTKTKRKNKTSASVFLTYQFKCDTLPSGALFLAIERPETYIIKINGVQLDSDDDCGWWCDRSLRKIAVNTALLRLGNNEITLVCPDYNEDHPGLESIFLLGSFGVKINNLELSLSSKPESLSLGDWGPQGLPFYSGAVAYCFNMNLNPDEEDKTILCLQKFSGVCARVFVNGVVAGSIGWPPYELDISHLIEMGMNEFKVEIFASRRNSHGPLYGYERWPLKTGSAQFYENAQEYNFVQYGLLQSPVIEIRKPVNKNEV